MDYIPSPPRTGIVQPAAQWSHAVPAYMPWGHQSNPAHFMRFQGGQMPVPGQLMVPGSPGVPPDLYVHPGDPCSSRSMPLVQGAVPYPSFPSTSYCIPRFKRKMPCDPADQIPAKQLVTEHMLERLNGLSLQDPCSSGYVPVKTAPDPPVMDDVIVAEDSFGFTESKAEIRPRDETASDAATSLVFTDAAKEIQRSHLNASSLEERLALNEVKKSTMALVPWTPPLIPVDSDKKFEAFERSSTKPEDEDGDASMEM